VYKFNELASEKTLLDTCLASLSYEEKIRAFNWAPKRGRFEFPALSQVVWGRWLDDGYKDYLTDPPLQEGTVIEKEGKKYKIVYRPYKDYEYGIGPHLKLKLLKEGEHTKFPFGRVTILKNYKGELIKVVESLLVFQRIPEDAVKMPRPQDMLDISQKMADSAVKVGLKQKIKYYSYCWDPIKEKQYIQEHIKEDAQVEEEDNG
jgi:hypothetical protein